MVQSCALGTSLDSVLNLNSTNVFYILGPDLFGH